MPKGVYQRSAVDVSTDGISASVEIPTTGNVSRDDLIVEVESQTDVSRFNSKAEELAFMEEKVEIFLHESTNPNEEPVVPVGVNGDNLWLQRGRNHVVKRKHVLNLLTARPVAYATVETLDRDGAKTIQLRSHTAIKYPFSIMADSKRGMEWASRIQTGK